jgi:hypothetical protein
LIYKLTIMINYSFRNLSAFIFFPMKVHYKILHDKYFSCSIRVVMNKSFVSHFTITFENLISYLIKTKKAIFLGKYDLLEVP